MKVNLQIEEDDQFRKGVKSLIEGQVRHILREELGGIVAGEIAKLRLMQPNSKALSDAVAEEIKRQTSGVVTKVAVQQQMQAVVHNAVVNQLNPLIADVKRTLLAQVAGKLTT